jgi:hypothetical protein
MGRPDNSLNGEAWQAFARRYRAGDAVTGRVSAVREYGVWVAITVDAERQLAVGGLMLPEDLPRGDMTRMYVGGQRVEATISRIKQDQQGRKGLLDLKPTLRAWRNLRQRYAEGATVIGSRVTSIDASRHRVYVLLHDLEYDKDECVGVLDKAEMFPCCRKDINHFFRQQELKLCIDTLGSRGGQWDMRLRMQRLSNTEFAAKFRAGAELDGTVHARDAQAFLILLDEGVIGTLPAAPGAASPQIGTKVRVRVDQPEEIRLVLQDDPLPHPRFGRVYWGEDNGRFTPKPYRPVVVLQTFRMVPQGWQVGYTQAIYLSTKPGHIPCKIDEVCFENRRASIVVEVYKRYPLEQLQHYWGELPQTYQQEIHRRLGFG